MITSTRYIQTPNGLHEIHTIYLDDDFNPVDQTVATQFHSTEDDSRGIQVESSFGFIYKNCERFAR